MPHTTIPDQSVSYVPAMEDTIRSDDLEQSSSDKDEAAQKKSRDKPTAITGKHARAMGLIFDDLFDENDNEDEESPRTEATDDQAESSPPVVPVQRNFTANFNDPEIMLAYYQRLFPFRYIFQWLNHSMTPSDNFGHREFAFTLRNDAYLRYQSFSTGDLLRKEILRLNPSRFEIGPVYTANPRDRKTFRKSTAFRPLTKELVFDIDLTDYDEVRTCCDKANICRKCWSFVIMAIKVVDAALKEDLGFRHVMWVYSGRRGAHAWISDKRAREMDDHTRKAVAGYLEVIKGGSHSGKKVNVKRPLHPHLFRSLNMLREHFQHDVLKNQNPWAESGQAERLLQLLPDKVLNEALRKKWEAAPGRSSERKWADIDTLASAGVSKALEAKSAREGLLEAKQDIVLEYTYPRLDVEVSKKQIHLLKSPFVVHPGTGRVCVPIDTERLSDFDPLSVPIVTELLDEIDGFNERTRYETEDHKLQDYEKTRLKPYVDHFRKHVLALLKDERGAKRQREEDITMEF